MFQFLNNFCVNPKYIGFSSSSAGEEKIFCINTHRRADFTGKGINAFPHISGFCPSTVLFPIRDVKILAANSERDPKSLLQEWMQARGYDHPKYRTVDAYGPDHAKIFEVEVLIDGRVYGRGVGNNKQAAAQAAARRALDSLR